MRENKRDCRHGQLARSCNLCELEAELASEKARADQLGINCRWLIKQMDKIHVALCRETTGTWQDRARSAVAAAKRLGT